jgi:hypothetical protein
MPATSVESLQQEIRQRERELQQLRQELQSRRDHLTELTRRKEELQNQLQQVEAEIAALATTTQRPQPAKPIIPPHTPGRTHIKVQPRLGELIVTMLREASSPMTARQLSEEAGRRGFRAKSQDQVKSMEARLQNLKHQGVVRRASGQPGYVLVPASNGASKQTSQASQAAPTGKHKAVGGPGKSKPAATKSSEPKASVVGAANTAEPERRGEQRPLRVVLTKLLKKSHKPLSGRELAEQALAAGYKSNAKNFVNAVSAMLAKMTNVEYVPEKGYRLKKP